MNTRTKVIVGIIGTVVFLYFLLIMLPAGNYLSMEDYAPEDYVLYST